MGILRYNYRSEVLGMHTDITITYPSGQYSCYEPKQCEKERRGIFKKGEKQYHEGMKLPTVYILHGGGDDDSLLYRYTRLEYYAEQNNVMTVTAQAHDSFFIDTAYGIPYYTFFSEELPMVVRSLFASSARREENYLIGMAMGGNAALMMAMKRPDLFAACVDLSGGIGCSLDSQYFVESFDQIQMPKMYGAFEHPGKLAGSEFDIGYQARKNVENKVKLPELYLAVGEDDFIRDVVRRDRDELLRLGIPFHYEEAPHLGHEWDFWDRYMKKALDEWLPLPGREKKK